MGLKTREWFLVILIEKKEQKNQYEIGPNNTSTTAMHMGDVHYSRSVKPLSNIFSTKKLKV
jgi:hypothetical protein